MLLLSAGCSQGCDARRTVTRWFGGGSTPSEPGGLVVGGVDCPDGLARCEAGTVTVSRLMTLPPSCTGSPEGCRCLWDRAADCDHGCVADGVEIVAERDAAAARLCAPAPGAAPVARALPPPAGGAEAADRAPPCPPPCDDLGQGVGAPSGGAVDDRVARQTGDAGWGTVAASGASSMASAGARAGARACYVCAGGVVEDCALRRSVAACARGCAASGAYVDGDGISSEAAFAMLCSR